VVTGQTRALEALNFGVGMGRSGYNIFAIGAPGGGKFTVIEELLHAVASQQQAPSDWCYVHNFEQPHRPVAIELPPGGGTRLHADMEALVEELGAAIPAAFDNEDTHARVEEIEEEFKERRNQALEELRLEGAERHIALVETPAGFTFAPVSDDNQVLNPNQFQRLPESEQKRVQEDVALLQERLQKLLRQSQGWRKETREKIKALHREIAQFAVGHLIDNLREQYRHLEAILTHLDAVEQDIVGHVNDFLAPPESPMFILAGDQRAAALKRYSVNLLVDNSQCHGAPVVVETLPSHGNLIGRAEYQAQMGTLSTDFTLIKPGALHRANGGYLLLDAQKVLMQPLAWDSLKRALESDEIRIESIERSLGLISSVSLEPEPIALDVKVILVGERYLFYFLHEMDPDIGNLFKVTADFDEMIERSAETQRDYARLVATIARRERLKPLDRHAVGRVIERASRITEDTEKLSVHLRSLTDLLKEADYWAGQAERGTVGVEDVQRAVEQQRYRSGRIRERIHDEIQRGTVMISTDGEAMGQANGLSVLEIGDSYFGQPSRITATARVGDGEVVDIEREIDMGGPIHSKGVLILSSFLMSRYAENHPISLAASLVFEQSYGMIDGDSASLAELCALLSVLARAPIRQCLAVTGSVNQHGEVQAIGGVRRLPGARAERRARRGDPGVQRKAPHVEERCRGSRGGGSIQCLSRGHGGRSHRGSDRKARRNTSSESHVYGTIHQCKGRGPTHRAFGDSTRVRCQGRGRLEGLGR
jgi:predicted ATP-dependent protease